MRIHKIYNPSTLGKLSLSIACALSFSATAAPAASVVAKVDASSLVTLQSNDINEMLALSGSESAKAVNSVNIATMGTIVTKFQQQLHGIDVFGRTFTAHQSAIGVFSDVKGKMVKGLKWQKKLSTSLITPEQALEIAVGSDRQGVDIADITNIQSQALIYPLAGKYVRVYRVSYFKDVDKPVRIQNLIDANSGEILDRANILTHANATESAVPFGKAIGPGGNEKVGLYHYPVLSG